MNWNDILFIPDGATMPEKISGLIRQQNATWPLFCEGQENLKKLQIKKLSQDGSWIIVQTNPARHRSTNAKVDTASISKRPCFLCPDHLPSEERALAYKNFVLLPNPYPILEGHMTVALRNHQPQELSLHFQDYLELTKDIGEEFLCLYNGPQCGASAPDHLHFQISKSESLPLFSQTNFPTQEGTVSRTFFGINFLQISSKSPQHAAGAIKRCLEFLSNSEGESLLNMLSTYRNALWNIFVFPRSKHRPDCFFEEGKSKIGISPAALELGGLMIVSDPGDFEKIDANIAHDIYKQVSCSQEVLSGLCEFINS